MSDAKCPVCGKPIPIVSGMYCCGGSGNGPNDHPYLLRFTKKDIKIAAATRRADQLALLEMVKKEMPKAPHFIYDGEDAGYADAAGVADAAIQRIRRKLEVDE